MSHIITIPEINKKVKWYDGDYTVVVGESGAGKTLFLHSVMRWCEEKGYSYAYYCPPLIGYAAQFIKEAKDHELFYVCSLMSNFSIDFSRDIGMWAEIAGYKRDQKKEYMHDRKVLEATLHRCGSGYTRMFIMLLVGIQNPSALYYLIDQPETSLHIHIQRNIIPLFMKIFFNMKLIFVTHSPEVYTSIEECFSTLKSDADKGIISLPEMYIE